MKSKNLRSINPTEDQIQKTYVEWARKTKLPSQYGKGKIGDYLFHAPSEGKRTKSFGKRLQDMGWSAGFPDIVIFIPRFIGEMKYSGLCIECKSQDGKMTKDQIKWRKKLEKSNFFYSELRTFEEMEKLTKIYLNIERGKSWNSN